MDDSKPPKSFKELIGEATGRALAPWMARFAEYLKDSPLIEEETVFPDGGPPLVQTKEDPHKDGE